MNTIIAIYKMSDEPGEPSNYSCLCDAHIAEGTASERYHFEEAGKSEEFECELCATDLRAQLEAMTIERDYWRDQYKPYG